jgi:fucose 4-O-acetylase-like acetyltransferase
VQEKTLDREYWNIVKGIGILCVVFGHACNWAQRYVYLFHLPIFFFVAGCFYSEIKYGDHPEKNLVNRLKSAWLPYVVIYFIIIALHNVFYKLGFLRLTEQPYTRMETLIKMSGAVFGNADELMAGPMWFIPVLVEAMVLFGFLVFLSRKLEEKTHSVFLKFLFQAVAVIGLAVLAYPVLSANEHFASNLHFALEALPYIWVGYLLRNYGGEWLRCLHLLPGVLGAVLLYVISRRIFLDWTLGLVVPYMHLIAFVGIYVCLVLAKYLKRVPVVSVFIGYLGSHSFFVMVAHFMLLRVTDRMISLYIGDTTRELYDVLPVAFPQMWPLYLLVAVFGSALLALFWDFVKKRVQNAWK